MGLLDPPGLSRLGAMRADGEIVTRSTKTTFYDDFTTKANGSLVDGAVSDSGHTYSVMGQIPWEIVGGRLTHTQTDTGSTQSSYLGVNLGVEDGDAVGYVWVEYEVPSGADQQESITLISSATDFCGSPEYEFANAQAHCTFTDVTFRHDALQATHPGLTTTVLGRGQYTALPAGTYRVEIHIDGTKSTVVDPYGVRYRVDTSSLVSSYAGPWATLQLYCPSGAAHKELLVLRWGAELQHRQHRGSYASAHDVARAATQPPRLLGAMQTNSALTATALTSSVSAKLYGLTIPIPKTRHVLCKGLIWLDETVPAVRTLQQLLVGVYVDGNSSFGKLTTLVSGYTPANGHSAYTVSLGASSAGTWTFTIGGQTTTSLAYNASAATVQSAIEALSNVGAGYVTVTLSGTNYTITFGGSGAAGKPSLRAADVSVTNSGGALAAVSAYYTQGRLFPWALELDSTYLGAFECGSPRDFQVKAQASASGLYTFIDNSDASGGTASLRRSTMEIYELP